MQIETQAGFESTNPGRDVQRIGTARFLGQDPYSIHHPVWAVMGNLGDSQCYLGVTRKVDAIHAAISARILRDGLPIRLVHPAYSIGVSDGQLNGTERMRFSLIGREVTNDSIDLHLNGNDVKGVIAVVACDKPPVGTLAAILEHNEPAVIFSDGSIRPGSDPDTGERIDLVTAFQVAGDPDGGRRARVALNACPGQGSCGGMFTYNTMQTFIAVLGMEPLHMVSPPSDDERRLREFPDQLIDCLLTMTRQGIKPRDIVTPTSLKNALTVTLAMGGSTNVALHAVEIARAAGIDFWTDVLSQKEFNALARRVPVLVNARPFGLYSMVDIDAKGGLQAIVNELLAAGLLDGGAITCTGETLAGQVRRLAPSRPDHQVIYSVARPFKQTGGLRLLQGNLAPNGGAIIKVAGVEGGMEDGKFTGRARLRRRTRAACRPGAHVRCICRQGHGSHPLPGTARGAGHAGDARSDFADHHALPSKGYYHRLDDRCPLFRRFGRVGRGPRRPRGLSWRADRSDRRRGHHCGGHPQRPPGLPRVGRRCGVRQTRQGMAGSRHPERRRAPQSQSRHQSFAQKDACQCPSRAARRRHGRGVETK
jgi:dihydroxy-acid dehydratase